MTAPLLDPVDFTRLAAGGAWSLLTRRRGLPPPWPQLPQAADKSLADLGLGEYLAEFQELLSEFFGLSPGPEAAATESLGHYARRLFEDWQSGPAEIVFHSSGSTGRPKPCPHSQADLKQEIEAVARLFPTPARIISAAPLLHSYGFVFGLLLPKRLGLPALSVVPLPGLLSAALAEGDLLLGFPWLLGQLAEAPAPRIQVLSSTAPCPEALFTELPQKGFSGLAEIYGSSETGAVAFRKTAAPFRLLDHWRCADGGFFRQNKAGDVFYPQLDHLDWADETHFRPAGRLDLAVQVGGVNVYPERVARLIEGEEGVREATVRLMSPEEGGRLKAFVVPEEGRDLALLRRSLSRVFRRLSPPERPVSLSFGPELPRGPAGKLCDWKI